MRYICTMNTRPFVDTPRDRTTQAAEGMLRRRFTVEELEAMVAAGIIGEDERIELIELIGGEVVPMSPKGNSHEVLKHALNIYWARRLPDHLTFAGETTFRLTPDISNPILCSSISNGYKRIECKHSPFRRGNREFELRLRYWAEGGVVRELRYP